MSTQLPSEPRPHASDAPDRVSSTDEYARRFEGAAGRYLLGVQTRGLLALTSALGSALRVLDIGGGHAQAAVPLAQAGHRVTILSSGPEAESRARRLCQGLAVEFRTGPLHEPPAEGFDLVVALRMVMHMPDWRAFLAGACGAASAGGAVLIDYPSWRSSNALEPLLFELKKQAEGGGTRRYEMFWPGQIREGFDALGFTRQRRWAQCALPLVVHRAAKLPAVTGAVESVCRAVGVTGLLGSPVLVLARRGERV
jgi:SAM-dependent methyltransferase